MTPGQIQAIEALSKAGERLEMARKEIREATQEHARALSKAHRLCPHVFGTIPERGSDDD